MSALVIMDYEKEYLEKFLETFPTRLHYKPPESRNQLYVFWSQDDEIQQQEKGFGFNNDSFSADVDTRGRMISDKIKHAFFRANLDIYDDMYIIQFWAPTVMTSSGRRLLSTSGQPFAFSWPFNKHLSKYRRRCMEYQYGINDHHNHDDDDDDDHDPMAMIISSDHAPTVSTAFLNRLPQFVSFKNLKGATSPLECHLNYSYMLPICFPSQTTSSSCIGVLEFSTALILEYSQTVIPMIRALKEVGLGVFEIQERIPYQIIPGLKPARNEIEQALKKIVCESSNTPLLAQVWIAFQGDNHMPFSSFSEATLKKQMLSLKLTGYLRDTEIEDYVWDPCNEYYGLCDMLPLEMGENFAGKTLEDYKPRFCNDVSKLSVDTLVEHFFNLKGSGLAICLNSIHTADFCYAFEFMWGNNSDSDVESVEDDPDSDVESVEDDPDSDVKFVEELLLKLKELLPSFKLASGAELGDELDFIKVGDSTATETKFLKIFQGKRLSPITEVLEEGRRIPVSVLVDYIQPLEAKSKKTPIPLSREVIQQQFVDTEEIEAAEKLKALERGKKTMVENCMAPSQRKYKTAPIHVSKEAIEHQYGNTMKEAAENLKVSISTLKRKCKDFGISEWQGRPRKVNDSSHQNNKNEEDIGAIEESYEVNKDTLTIKAEYNSDMMKFHLCISDATFITIEEVIGKKFKLTHGTYKLKYLDEDKDWIVLASNEDMSDCIKSSKNLGRIVLRMRVLPSTQPISS